MSKKRKTTNVGRVVKNDVEGEYPSKAVENKPRSDSRGFRVQSVERRTA